MNCCICFFSFLSGRQITEVATFPLETDLLLDCDLVIDSALEIKFGAGTDACA